MALMPMVVMPRAGRGRSMRTAPSTSMWNPLRAVRITRFKLQCGTESGSATSWLWLQHFTTRSGCQIHKMGPRGLAGPVPSAFWADRMEALQAGTLSETGSSEGGGITRCGACLVCVLFADWALGSQDSCLYALAWDRNVSLRPFPCHQLSDTPGPIKIGLPGREGLQRDRAAVHRLGTSSRLHPLVASFFFFLQVTRQVGQAAPLYLISPRVPQNGLALSVGHLAPTLQQVSIRKESKKERIHHQMRLPRPNNRYSQLCC